MSPLSGLSLQQGHPNSKSWMSESKSGVELKADFGSFLQLVPVSASVDQSDAKTFDCRFIAHDL